MVKSMEMINKKLLLEYALVCLTLSKNKYQLKLDILNLRLLRLKVKVFNPP
jgi:hypothetical protein